MANTLNCLIIEDEPLAQELIEKYIKRTQFLTFAGTCENAIDGREQIRNLKPDIVFLDINMPEMTGMELLGSLGIHKPYIIITTGYPDFAADSYSFEVTDYLLKPISFDRFLRAVSKVQERIEIGLKLGGKSNSLESNSLESNSLESNGLEKDFFFLKVDKKSIKVFFEEIILVQGEKDYMTVFTKDNNYLVHGTMKSMEDKLPKNKFLRINRSYIIHLDAVRVIDGNQIELISKRKVDIGITYQDAVFKKLGI